MISNKINRFKNAKIDNAKFHKQHLQSIFEIVFFAIINVAINCSRNKLFNQIILLIQKQINYLHAFNKIHLNNTIVKFVLEIR